MIIGVSGKIGSGKDTVGLIIRYLTMCNVKLNYTETQFNEFTPFLNKSKWEIKKFAYKVKHCASIISGIPIEDFEKIEVKSATVSPEWFKNTVEFTNRELFLQIFGTDACRNIVHDNIWVNALFSEYKIIGVKGWQPSYSNPDNNGGEESEPIYPNWIITDIRFVNELEAVKSRGGITIRVNRWTDLEARKQFAEVMAISKTPVGSETVNMYNRANHPSETALDNAVFDYTIDNNGTIEKLIVKVKEILIKEKII